MRVRNEKLETNDINDPAPICETNGNFRRKQCHDGYCWCVTPEVGYTAQKFERI